ncbi:MAG: DUF4159 domain-containing protein [Verrucomicrobia bacterium]|nr:MAG: DUF4159 domain-containing protein [Verrucomicrobiota bacterium]
MNRARKILLLALVAALPGAFCTAQRWRNRASSEGTIYTEGGVPVNEDTVKTAREIASHSTGTPEWTNETGFEQDVFTFVRIIRDGSPYDSPSAGSWITDFPDSDLNLSFRLQQMTSLKVDPDGRVMRLTDPDLFNYPWIYMVEPGSLLLRDEEVPVLRKYLLNGGVLMADDFWGEWQWESFHREIKRVLSERQFVELPMDHPIFHCVFDLRVPKNKLQTPNVWQGSRSRNDGVTWERHRRKEGGWEECTEMHVRAILDEKGRMMVIAVHNCDNGDGWEREGEDDYFFHEFSEKRAYPLGINIIFYLMTH